MADIFVSYAKARSAEAQELAEELTDLGYDVWWDTSLLPTGLFGAEIDRQLDAARAVIVIWSPEAAKSKWVRSEASHADRESKLVNIHTSDLLDPARQIPKPFEQTHSVGIDSIRAVVAALDALGVPRSGGRPTTPSEAKSASADDTDDRLFGEVEKSGTAQAYEYYLDELPAGRHVLIARFRLKALQPTQPNPPDHSQLLTASASPPYWPPASTSPLKGEAALRPGVIKVDAKFVYGASDGLFKPGTGKTEWFKDLDVGPEMVVVPAGSFMMGSNNNSSEQPPHQVAIGVPFAVGRFAITFDEWDAAGLPYRPSDDNWGRGRQPVINVSWDDAKAYVAWLSQKTELHYRLLSESEWEYACRAGTTTRYAFGEFITNQQAHFSESMLDRGKQPAAVGTFPPNGWGLYDMHGNVWEWCEDNWHPDYQGAPQDGSVWLGGDSTLRVLRGGSGKDYPAGIGSADRHAYPPIVGFRYGGFRVARSL